MSIEPRSMLMAVSSPRSSMTIFRRYVIFDAELLMSKDHPKPVTK